MLQTNSFEIWENEVEPFISDKVIKECRTDEILVSTLEKLVNSVNSDILEKKNFAFRLEPIVKVLTSPSYYVNGAMKRAFPEEIKTVKELTEKLSSLLKVAKYDLSKQPQVEEPKTGRERLPNPTDADVRDLYKPMELRPVRTQEQSETEK
jgi:hypothetical protein